MLAGSARVVLVDRDEAALTALREKQGDAVIPLSSICLTRGVAHVDAADPGI
jgi:hypothetical protein